MQRHAARRILGVGPGASASEVETAFRRAAQSAHPDRGGVAEVFHELVTARNLLVLPQERGPSAVLNMTIRRSPGRRLLRAVRARLPSAARRHLS